LTSRSQGFFTGGFQPLRTADWSFPLSGRTSF
jgi:hypothetical protein